ncbi:glutamyl-tRNA synthetase [Paenibacillus mucilaginosus 3016]|uniref:Glutamate--tRNA ligase n=1 Tax=Paenibacillus mucilaginosus 3016 TaxID=1116391 RepID=H6NRG2_9BACL|nr:glutamate--tRNA ligase [Paenibacillus mucilaginosus]AFC33597.1 glutamyl-tRNA synthetase [Paenibacillus mucilaginosus 3016]WFA21996.1 glutamate--tRNA ligase [Paenibacillus mucilaginosus]
MKPMEYKTAAELIWPGALPTPLELEEQYPLRKPASGAIVTRFAPSPTGFLHLGGLFTAFIAGRLAAQTGGRFYLRIEDTDQKREVEGGTEAILEALRAFGVTFDEGTGEAGERGSYGPYKQSRRREIYTAYAKDLMERGLAYPCFCTEEKLAAMRAEQEAQGLTTGYYGKWAVHRDLPLAEVRERIEQGQPYTVRLRSPGDPARSVIVEDLVKGTLTLPENHQDIVLLKADGLPTYHLAHAVDDHLMRTTHVIRGDEWLSSLPVHLQLWEVLGFEAPVYAHLAPILKQQGASKRKLSKRKDPEAAVSYYAERGVPPEAVLEYLLQLANWTFEDWCREHPDAPLTDFALEPGRLNRSGALFDGAKLEDTAKEVVARMTAEEVYNAALAWGRRFHPAFAGWLEADPGYAQRILAIGRGGTKPRKDIAKWSELPAYIGFFYEEPEEPARTKRIQARMRLEQARDIVRGYLAAYDEGEAAEEWFGTIRGLAAELGYADSPKTYKKNPAGFNGHTGDVAMVLRLVLTGREQTPDLYEICSILGGSAVRRRLAGWLEVSR